MTAKEPKETLANVPDDAEVYMDAYASGRECVTVGSVIKWQTGTPDTCGRYIITTEWKEVTADWYDKDLGWFKYFDKDIIAWCPLNKIEPYKPIE